MSLSNQKCEVEPTLINLHTNKYKQEFHYYQFAVKLDRYVGSCNTLNDLSNKLCVPNKIEDLNIHVFDMIKGKNESKILTKDISRKCKCKFDGRICNSNQKWNNDKCRCECKKHHICEKGCIWNPATCSCKNDKYLASIIDDPVITCDEIIYAEAKLNDEETKTVPTNYNEKNITCKTENFYIILGFLLITIALLISVSIYCYLIKYRAKQKHLLPFHETNNELKMFVLIIYYQKTESKNELKEIDIKNHTCYYFNDVIKIKDFDINNI